MYYLYPVARILSLLLHETEVELRSSVITMISSKCNGIQLASIPNKIKTGNYTITFCLVNKCIGDNYH